MYYKAALSLLHKRVVSNKRSTYTNPTSHQKSKAQQTKMNIIKKQELTTTSSFKQQRKKEKQPIQSQPVLQKCFHHNS